MWKTFFNEAPVFMCVTELSKKKPPVLFRPIDLFSFLVAEKREILFLVANRVMSQKIGIPPDKFPSGFPEGRGEREGREKEERARERH
jgi:hypothetical protein